MASVFILDDDEMICQLISTIVSQMGHEAHYALRLHQGLQQIAEKNIDIVFLDVRLPDGNGLSAISEIREHPNHPEVIIITGEGSPEGAEFAIEYGAWDYIQKPLSKKKVQLSLSRTHQYRQNLSDSQPQPVALNLERIVGKSKQIKECYNAVARAATSNTNVLIWGETGTGKEVFAKAIHENCICTQEPFVVVDCAALPETLIESALFGYEKGAFTGAEQRQTGLIAKADGGTLFLDEVGELPMSLQKTFLRVLQEKTFRPVGSTKEQRSDFRLIAATNRNLEECVEEGRFREDLLYRLKGITIELPPLRGRLADIKDLALHYIDKICARYEIEPKTMADDFLEALFAYSWRGNVRELINSLEEAISQARFEPVLFANHLPSKIRVLLAKKSVAGRTVEHPGSIVPPAENGPREKFLSYQRFADTVLADHERRYLLDLLRFAQNNISEASRVAGLGRTRLYKMLKKHNISRKFL